MAGGYPVAIRAEVEGIGITDEISNLTTTRVKKSFVSGLLSLALAYRDMGSLTSKCAYIVFDALDDSDAATKLASATGRETIFVGERRTFQFSEETPCYRVDFIADVALSGASVLTLSGKVPV